MPLITRNLKLTSVHLALTVILPLHVNGFEKRNNSQVSSFNNYLGEKAKIHYVTLRFHKLNGFLNTNLFCIVFLLRVHLITEGTCIFSFPPKWRGTRAFHSGAKHTSHFNTLWRVSTDILVSENFEFVGLIRPLNFKYFSSQTTGLGSFAWLRLKIPKDHHWRK